MQTQRPLRAKELDLLRFVLPAGRPGYREYRDRIGEMVVLGEGRRGPGNLILGASGDVPDAASPMGPVVAYGMVETTRDDFSVTVREYRGRQIEVELVSGRGGEVPEHFEEKRRWTYSNWEPGMASPRDGSPLREVAIDPQVVLAIAAADRRVWVWERPGGTVRPVPVSHFFDALMHVRNDRNPATALHPTRLFEELGRSSDTEIRRAFVAYNGAHPKVALTTPVSAAPPRRWTQRIRRFLGRTG